MQKPRFYTGFFLLIGGSVWESNPSLSLTRDISFEGCGAHQGHIHFQYFIAYTSERSVEEYTRQDLNL